MIRPMRGVALPDGELNGIYLASPKIDGIRAWVKDGQVLSKTGKPLPNPFLHELFGNLNGADGEITVGPPYAVDENDDVFDRTRGHVMQKKPKDSVDFQFHVFDRWDTPDNPAYIRCVDLEEFRQQRVNIVLHGMYSNRTELDLSLDAVVAKGYEGMMLRYEKAGYKYGQSTAKEGYLLKLKLFEDSEAVVLSVIEQTANTNEAKTDELGYTKRSSSKSGKVGKGTFGTFLAKDLYSGRVFQVGNGKGITDRVRAEWWEARETLPGKLFRYTYQKVGTKFKPRIPQFKAWVDATDLADYRPEMT